MVGKKSGRAMLREEGTPRKCNLPVNTLLTQTTGLARTDNNLDLTTWPQVQMINQKNYYTYAHAPL
jgi:actin-related protein 8